MAARGSDEKAEASGRSAAQLCATMFSATALNFDSRSSVHTWT